MSTPTRRTNDNMQELVALAWGRKFGNERLCLKKEHAQNADAGAQTTRVAKLDRRFVVTAVRYVNPTGLAAHGSNYAAFELKQGSVVVASFDTNTAAGNVTLTANAYQDATLSVTAADLIIEADEVLSWVVTETGTTTVPAGCVEVYGYYVADDTAPTFFRAKRDFKVDSVYLKLLSGLTANNTNYYVFTLKNGSTTVASYDTRAAHEGTLTADTFGAMVLGTAAGQLLAAGDKLTLDCNENGDALLSDLELVLHGRYL